MSPTVVGIPSWFVATGSFLLAAAGVAILFDVAARWAGRKRQWVARPSRALLAITIIPAIGVVSLLVSIAIAVGQPSATPLVIAALAVMWLGIVLHMWQPNWWGPRWYREVQAAALHPAPRPLTRFERPVFDRPSRRLGGSRQAVAIHAPSPDEPAIRWPASWVLELDLGDAAHGVRLFDEVSGSLELRSSRLTFASDWYADAIRNVPTIVIFEPGDVMAIRTVPRGADAFGVVTRGARRSPTPGLVIETDAGPFLFGLSHLDEAARSVAAFAGLDRAPEGAPAPSPSILPAWRPAAGVADSLLSLLGPADVVVDAGEAGDDMPPPELELMDYRHPSAGFSLPLPEGWLRVEDRNGIALIAAEPFDASWPRSNVVVTIERLAPGTTLAAWLDASLELLTEGLDQFFLVDVAETANGDRPSRRVLAHHATPSGAALTTDQWLVVEGSLGYTVTVSVATLDYDAFAPFATRIGGGFRPDPEFRP